MSVHGLKNGQATDSGVGTFAQKYRLGEDDIRSHLHAGN